MFYEDWALLKVRALVSQAVLLCRTISHTYSKGASGISDIPPKLFTNLTIIMYNVFCSLPIIQPYMFVVANKGFACLYPTPCAECDSGARVPTLPDDHRTSPDTQLECGR